MSSITKFIVILSYCSFCHGLSISRKTENINLDVSNSNFLVEDTVRVPTCAETLSGVPHTAGQSKLKQQTTKDNVRPDLCSNPVEENLDHADPFVLNYKTTPDFLKGHPYDVDEALLQNLPSEFPGTSRGGLKGADSSHMKFWTCQSSEEQKETVVQRFGPFVSTGGYSWNVFSLFPVANTDALIKKHPAGFSIEQIGMVGVDKHGGLVDQPPLHIHHGKFNLGGSWFKQDDYVSCWLGTKDDCRQVFYNIEGDLQCTDATGGSSCLNWNVPSGYGLHFKEPVGFYALMNDVRKGDSPEMEWYMQWHLRILPKEISNLRPISMLSFQHPGIYDAQGFRANTGSAFHTRLDRESFVWETLAMPVGGKLVRGNFHYHGMNIEDVWTFSTTPLALGLSAAKFHQKHAWEPLYPEDVSMKSNAQVKQYVMDNFNDAAAKDPSAALRCKIKGMNDVIDGWDVYRKAEVCCQNWNFKKGDILTHVTFMVPRSIHFAHLPADGPAIVDYPQHSIVYYWFESNEIAAQTGYYGVYGNHKPENAMLHFGPQWILGSMWQLDGILAYYYSVHSTGAEVLPVNRLPFYMEVFHASSLLAQFALARYGFYIYSISAVGFMGVCGIALRMLYPRKRV